MPVAIEMNFKGATLEQYDKIVELMGLASGNIRREPSSTGRPRPTTESGS